MSNINKTVYVTPEAEFITMDLESCICEVSGGTQDFILDPEEEF